MLRSDTQSLLESQGYCLLPSGLDEAELDSICQELDTHGEGESSKSQAGRRDALEHCPKLEQFARHGFGLAELFAGRRSQIVRCVVFDKTPSSNWKIGWHQDLNIKSNGVNVVPRERLQDVITLRLHLDPTPVSNGALRVLPGSHRHGPLTDERRRNLETIEIAVEAETGDVLVMSPLLVHASSSSVTPGRRRVVHVDYLLSSPSDDRPSE